MRIDAICVGAETCVQKCVDYACRCHHGTFVLFGAGLGEVVMGVVKLAWGGAPAEDPGMMYWSWPVIQMVCVVVVWAWSRVFVRLIEEATNRGLAQWPRVRGL